LALDGGGADGADGAGSRITHRPAAKASPGRTHRRSRSR
jgi:hypothetical protein